LPTDGNAGNSREVVLDIRDRAGLEAVGRQTRFDVVFDLASRTEVGLPKADYQWNLEATKSMLSFISHFDIPRYFFFSTQFVYRTPDRAPANETDFHPVDDYGASKVESELAIRATLPSDRFLILRPTYVWGPGLTRFRDGLLLRLAKGQLLLSSDPSFVRYYGYVRTVCQQAISLATMDNHHTHNVYYLSDDAIDLQTFCDALRTALGKGKAIQVPSTFIRMLGRAGHVLAGLGLPSPINAMQARELTTNFPIPIERTLDLVPARTDLAAAAAETVAWAKSDPSWALRAR
jgi:nucleoside-diphosphate-sugar epimerase